MQIKLLILLLLSTSIFAQTKGVYDDDNRLDFNELTDERHREWALSTAAMIPSYIVQNIFNEDHFTIKAKLLSQQGICPNERFAGQITASQCSGFLVGEDLLATAGHCMVTKSDCKGHRWVFDYRQSESYRSGRTIRIPVESVYRCEKIITTFNDGKSDYAIIKLNRPVLDRRPFKLSHAQITKKMNLTIAGYPTGLPVKVAPGAKALKPNLNKPFFIANTDSFEGNSGSPVINSDTGEVMGILVRGSEDYEYARYRGKRCLKPVVCTTQDHCEGEAVTKVSQFSKYLLL